MALEFLKLALRNIGHRRRRTWLTILGTMIGILAIVALISIGQGLENSVQSEIKELGGNKVFVSPGGGRFQQFTGTTLTLTDNDLQAIRNTRGVDRAVGFVTGSVLAEYNDDSAFANIRSAPSNNIGLIREVDAVDIEQGRFLRPADTTNIVVTENSAESLFEEEIEVGSRVSIQERKFRVVGIVSRGLSSGGGVYAELDTARDILNKSEGFDSILVEVQDGLEPSEVEENIRRNLRNSRGVEEGEEDFSTRTAAEIIRSFNNQLAIIRGVLIGVGAISLLVGAVGIMNTMYTAVTQRTREIGVMKAIGATNNQILLLFMAESGIIGAVGGLIGVLAGVGVSQLASTAISRSIGIQYSAYVAPDLVIGSIAFAFVVGMVSGVLPARKAAQLQPAEALRYG